MELKRVLNRKGSWILLIALFSLNLFLFGQEQENRYGGIARYYGATVREMFQEYNRLIKEYGAQEPEQALSQIGNRVLGESLEDSVKYGMLRESLEYQAGYAEYLREIQNNAAVMGSIGIFNQEDSFSSRNIRKTAEDFQRIIDVELSLGNYQ